MQRETADLELPEREAEGAAGIGFLDAAGQRALAADAEPVGVGEIRSGEGAGRKDQRIARRQRVDLGHPHPEQRLRNEIAAGSHHGLAVKFFRFDLSVGEMDVQVFAHGQIRV